LNIRNIYLPNQHKFTKNDTENIIKQFIRLSTITGDFNNHNNIRGSRKTDNLGNEIEKTLNDENLTLLNNLELTSVTTSPIWSKLPPDITMQHTT